MDIVSEPMESIGFYTLSDARVAAVSGTSPLWRCELLLTDKCNFKCPYCRGVDKEYAGELAQQEAERTLDLWISQGLKNIRFSGGEPLLWLKLDSLVERCVAGGVKRVAISSNGSIASARYEQLTDLGVNDWSISLDACCASTGDHMAGDVPGAWRKVIKNIEMLAKRTYVTVGIVLTDENADEMHKTVELAHNLGVSDIRIISAAQQDKLLLGVDKIPAHIVEAHPILKYRVENVRRGISVRGLSDTDYNRCAIVLDDMAAVGGYHFPCIIYLREGGSPIGKIGPSMRKERVKWSKTHDVLKDPICKKNCLDVCSMHNSKYREFHRKDK